MYDGFYRLKENPFRLAPDPAFIYMTAQHREALAGLVYSAYTRPGLTVLLGEAGTGKTTLLYALLKLLEKLRFVSALCNNPTLTREEFYDLLLAKLGVECDSSLKSRQLIALQDTLLRYREDGRRAILIVDEAQRLSPEVLEEIRLLLNLETPREKLLDIIVAGQPELAEVLGRTELRQLKQRVSRVCRLQPLSAEDIDKYLHHRLAQAGRTEPGLFSRDTLGLIHEYTSGIPRLVNSLCDAALQTGFAMQSPQITVQIVREAAKDLDLKGLGTQRMWDFPANGASHSAAAAAGVSAVPAAKPAAPASIPTESNGYYSFTRVPLDHYGEADEEKGEGFFASLRRRLWS